MLVQDKMLSDARFHLHEDKLLKLQKQIKRLKGRRSLKFASSPVSLFLYLIKAGRTFSSKVEREEDDEDDQEKLENRRPNVPVKKTDC